MENKVLDELVKLSSSVINLIIKDMLPKISSVVDEEVTKLNKMVANEGGYDFDVSILGDKFPLNLTMTAAPRLTGDLIEINFDGLFHDPENASAPFDFDPIK
jgi:hypothetical protein